MNKGITTFEEFAYYFESYFGDDEFLLGINSSDSWDKEQLCEFMDEYVNATNFMFEQIIKLNLPDEAFDYVLKSLYENNEKVQTAIRDIFDVANIIKSDNAKFMEKHYYEGAILEYLEFTKLLGELRYIPPCTLEDMEDEDILVFKEWLFIKKSSLYGIFYMLKLQWATLYYERNVYETKKIIIEKLKKYKPTKEHRLDAYFICNNDEALKSILRIDAKGRKGVQLSIVLRALDDAGCTRKGGVKPLLENILKPIYGAEGTHQALSDAIKNVNDSQTMETIKQKAEVYKKQLK